MCKGPPIARLQVGESQIYLQHTWKLGEICQKLGWMVNFEKSELDPNQVFDFVGYQFGLKSGRVDTMDFASLRRRRIV